MSGASLFSTQRALFVASVWMTTHDCAVAPFEDDPVPLGVHSNEFAASARDAFLRAPICTTRRAFVQFHRLPGQRRPA
jgi:hypothetical protein